MSAMTEVLKDLEKRRLRALVDVDADILNEMHASDFVLVHPSGGTWSKAQYIGGVVSGEIDYRKFEAVSDVEVMVDGNLAVLRYRSTIEIHVRGQEPGPLECWHTDCYRRVDTGSPWQVVWSQATECA
ncbi:nuclear transport factor 2 family protein [Dactylosporangium sp. NPDC048998]|uniref:nuclear transport factor 2 family protein n=1 Tax=Dactylosporangium sp. NPDC048998 TaxID=3363976 RepID=UPI00372353C0